MTQKRQRKQGTRYGKDMKAINSYWMYGIHACAAALDNPEREIMRILASKNVADRLNIPDDLDRPAVEITEGQTINQLLAFDAVHQGIAMQVKPLDVPEIDDILDDGKPIIMLDQVTDPHNIGAILRSAAAFNVAGVIVTKTNAPKESAVMAKTACGALETVPLIAVSNFANTIAELKREEFWVWGMDGEAEQTLREAKPDQKTVLIMGAEGKGMRRLTAENCDLLVKLPMHEQMESLNVSNAAAIAMYEIFASK